MVSVAASILSVTLELDVEKWHAFSFAQDARCSGLIVGEEANQQWVVLRDQGVLDGVGSLSCEVHAVEVDQIPVFPAGVLQTPNLAAAGLM